MESSNGDCGLSYIVIPSGSLDRAVLTAIPSMRAELIPNWFKKVHFSYINFKVPYIAIILFLTHL